MLVCDLLPNFLILTELLLWIIGWSDCERISRTIANWRKANISYWMRLVPITSTFPSFDVLQTLTNLRLGNIGPQPHCHVGISHDNVRKSKICDQSGHCFRLSTEESGPTPNRRHVEFFSIEPFPNHLLGGRPEDDATS